MAIGARPATFGARHVARHDVPLSIADDPFFPEDPGIRAPPMSEQFGAALLEKQARSGRLMSESGDRIRQDTYSAPNSDHCCNRHPVTGFWSQPWIHESTFL
jgi:hypothetical protein